MELTFLGTGSAYPSHSRGASAIILHHNCDGSQWLFDCGEGTQIQVQKDKKVKISKIKKIFITHMHGDHMYGLPGLLSSIGIIDEKKDSKFVLDIYGPVGLKKFIRTIFGLVSEKTKFTYRVHEIDIPDLFNRGIRKTRLDPEAEGNPMCGESEVPKIKEIVHDEYPAWKLFHCNKTNTTVWAVPLKHTTKSLGYVILSDDKPGKMNLEAVKKLGVKIGPLLTNLKNGKEIITENGNVVRPSDVLSEPKPGINIGIMGDSCDSSHLIEFMLKRPKLNNSIHKPHLHYLVHECTLQNELEEECIYKGHSTPRMVADWANQLNVNHLILTHFSQRYVDDELDAENLENINSCLYTNQKKDTIEIPNSKHKIHEVNVSILKQQIVEGRVFNGDVTLARDFLTVKLMPPRS